MELSPSMLARPFLVHNDPVSGDAPAFVLPAGTVSFLLTDVEGSTKLWQERQDEMGPAIARHYAILDDAITGSGGVRPVEQGEGDSVVGAFARAGDAVAAALRAQVRLAEELPWLPVRMAIHTGEAQMRDEGNYVGRTIIRCARLRACGHGAQVLVSETTAALLDDELPDGASLLDLGVARLRDLRRSERVWQLTHPGLRSSFPPLRSLDHAPHNLPVPLTSFIGREAEQATVAGLLREHRLVTLTGSGGSGKTRLAQHSAADVIGFHEGGTWWVELASVTAASEVAERLAVATGFMPLAGADVMAQVVRHLRDAGAVLVVLDNAEHVIDEASRVAEALVSGCLSVRVLVTSREPLGVPGEMIWRVPSLSVPERMETGTVARLETFDAARLFIERARFARPNLIVDDAAVPAIASICARLDGVPLALELAAARVRTLSLDRLADGLDDAFRLLTGGSRTVLARQQTLLASIAWSVDLLDASERAVLHRLAVFPSSFSLDAAEAVAADGEMIDSFAVMDLLGRLVDKSLVQFDDASGRYRMLETIRQFSFDRLREVGEIDATRSRQSAYYARWCMEVGNGRHGIARGPLHREMPSVVVAMQWARHARPADALQMCAGLAELRPTLGHFRDVHETCDWLLDFDRDGPLSAAWAAAVAGIISSAVVVGRFDVLALRNAVEVRLRDDDRRSLRRLSGGDLLVRALAVGDTAPLVDQAAHAVADGDDVGVSVFVGLAVLALAMKGDFAEAQRWLDVIHRTLERQGVAVTVDNAGQTVTGALSLFLRTGRFAEAKELARAERPFDVFCAATAAPYFAYLAALVDNPETLDVAARWSDVEAPEIIDVCSVGVDFYRFVCERRWLDAASRADQMWEASGWMHVGRIIPLPIHSLARLEAQLLADARQYVEEGAASIAGFANVPLSVASVAQSRAQIALFSLRDEEAIEHAHALLALAAEHGFALMIIDALEMLAVVADREGESEVAALLLGATRAERERIGYRLVMLAPQADFSRLEERTPMPDAPLSIDAAVEYIRRSRGERGRPSHGWRSLTPTELRVVDLVAEGAANATVAKQLVMSPATVKSHLSHVFTKLGVGNRTELAAEALRRRGDSIDR